MARNDGHIPIARSFFEHELWNEKREFSKAEAWLWIIYQARYKPTEKKRIIARRLVRWEQGQVAAALEFFRRAWNWGSTKKVTNFFKYLEANDMITVDTSQGITVLTINNYLKHNSHLIEEQHGSTRTGSSIRLDPASVKESQSSIINQKTSIAETTAELVTYWNECNGTRLTPKASGRSNQVRARLKTFSIEDIKRAIFVRSADSWIKENDQQANWDAVMRSDKSLDQWLNRKVPKSAKNSEHAPEEMKKAEHPAKSGFMARPQAMALAESKRKEFNESNFDKIKYENQYWYKPLFQ